jgi:hypothetical protein
MRVSEFQRQLREAPLEPADTDRGATQLNSLNSSLLQDLLRFEPAAGKGLELLEVLAAAVRHGRPLRVFLQHGFQVAPVSVFPAQRLVHTPMRLQAFLDLRLAELRVLQVQNEKLEPAQAPGHAGSLGLLLWELALRGSRNALLPEIAGQAAYRVAPGCSFDELGLKGSLGAAVERLGEEATTLRGIAQWPGFDDDRARRLLNGLYLQAALIVSRSTPAATQRD